ncbi:WxL domain-containing protein [Enterococcus termitis]|uniref:WxL domain-containing protein n=1 Tax=Enterococcus termitis TaxID=332950 RepID=A0A1E5GD93_9ENTE|nr:WxL domain-containing protein [Enterococcus termitis]OEG10662.1 hypothetical protein BCR25_09375 [Enterococcus termitis]OJG97926.1 hypothetical protein RV18_GL003940 [Enterococcus termitis]
MKKAILATLLSATALTLLAVPADAATKKTETDIGVQFKSDDPTVESGMKPYRNNLSVVFKPSSFEFGEVKSQPGSMILNNIKGANAGLGEKIDPKGSYLVVNDDRDITKQPNEELGAWTLTAQLSELQTADKTAKLSNAKLDFKLDGLKKYDISASPLDSENDYIPLKPWESDKDSKPVVTDFAPEDVHGVGIPDATKVLTLEAGVNQQVAILTKEKANKYNKGVITSIRDVKLSVIDADQKDQSFKGTITWTLDDAPKFG